MCTHPVSVIMALPFGRRYTQQHNTKQLLPGWPPAIELRIQHVVWLAWLAFKCPAAMKAGRSIEIHFAHDHVSGRAHLLPQPDGHVKITEVQTVVREAQDAGRKIGSCHGLVQWPHMRHAQARLCHSVGKGIGNRIRTSRLNGKNLYLYPFTFACRFHCDSTSLVALAALVALVVLVVLLVLLVLVVPLVKTQRAQQKHRVVSRRIC